MTPIPVVPMARHRAIAWPIPERAALAARLAALGLTITEASDARELAGRPRLSESTPEQRHYSPLWFLGSTGREYLAEARTLRVLYTEALAQHHPDTVYTARRLLGLRRSTPSALRLCELSALVAQCRVVEIVAEEREPTRLAA